MPKALILKVTLEHRKPLTWRRLAVPVDVTYAQLHQILQVAFGWENYHLYGFYPAWNRRLSYVGDQDDPLSTAEDAHTAKILPDLKHGTVQYTYDFGESWDHRIKLEETRDIDGQLPICLAGRGNGFYEDGLGVRDDRFDMASVNQALQFATLPEDQATDAMLAQLDSVVTQDVSRQVAIFTKAMAAKHMPEVPTDMISVYVRMFVMFMQDLPMKQWTQAKLKQGLSAMVTELGVDADVQRDMVLLIGEFLDVMAKKHELAKNMTSRNVTALMAQIVLEFDLMADDDDVHDDDDQEDAMWSLLIDHYNPMLDRFYSSAQFRLLNLGTGSEVDDLLLDFFAAMYRETGEFVDQWQPAQVKQVLEDDYPNSVGLNRAGAEIFPKVVVAFFKTLQANRDLTQVKAAGLIKAVQASASSLLEQASDEEDESSDVDFAENMIHVNYDALLQQFFTSEQWLKIDYHDQAAATSMIIDFMVQMVLQHDVMLDEWRPAELTDMMLGYYPAYVSMPKEYFAALVDLVTGFVDYLHQHKQLAAKPANRIIKTMQNNAAHMLELAEDPDNWSADKQFLEAHPDQVNMNQQDDLPFSDDDFDALMPPAVAMAPLEHVQTLDGRKWRQATATRVHHEAGDLMWAATRDAEDQRIATDFADELYAKQLLTPLNWTPEAVQTVWQQHIQALDQETQVQHAVVLHDYLEALSELKSMSKKQAGRLQAVIQVVPSALRKVVPFKPRS
jgi:hypothetical protein